MTKAKCILLIVASIIALSSAAAQSSSDIFYLGFRLSGASYLEELGGGSAFVGLQLGTAALKPLELRVSYDLVVGIEYLLADLFYTWPLTASERLYSGIGLTHYHDGWNAANGYGLQATGGIGLRNGIVGFFAELQPIYGFELGALRARFNAGVNLHF